MPTLATQRFLNMRNSVQAESDVSRSGAFSNNGGHPQMVTDSQARGRIAESDGPNQSQPQSYHLVTPGTPSTVMSAVSHEQQYSSRPPPPPPGDSGRPAYHGSAGPSEGPSSRRLSPRSGYSRYPPPPLSSGCSRSGYGESMHEESRYHGHPHNPHQRHRQPRAPFFPPIHESQQSPHPQQQQHYISRDRSYSSLRNCRSFEEYGHEPPPSQQQPPHGQQPPPQRPISHSHSQPVLSHSRPQPPYHPYPPHSTHHGMSHSTHPHGDRSEPSQAGVGVSSGPPPNGSQRSHPPSQIQLPQGPLPHPRSHPRFRLSIRRSTSNEPQNGMPNGERLVCNPSHDPHHQPPPLQQQQQPPYPLVLTRKSLHRPTHPYNKAPPAPPTPPLTNRPPHHHQQQHPAPPITKHDHVVEEQPQSESITNQRENEQLQEQHQEHEQKQQQQQQQEEKEQNPQPSLESEPSEQQTTPEQNVEPQQDTKEWILSNVDATAKKNSEVLDDNTPSAVSKADMKDTKENDGSNLKENPPQTIKPSSPSSFSSVSQSSTCANPKEKDVVMDNADDENIGEDGVDPQDKNIAEETIPVPDQKQNNENEDGNDTNKDSKPIENKAADKEDSKNETDKNDKTDKSVPEEEKEMINDALLLASIAAMARTEVKTVSTAAETPPPTEDKEVVSPVVDNEDEEPKGTNDDKDSETKPDIKPEEFNMKNPGTKTVTESGTTSETKLSANSVTTSGSTSATNPGTSASASTAAGPCAVTTSPPPNVLDQGSVPITPNTTLNTVDTMNQTPSLSKTSSIVIEDTAEGHTAPPAMTRHVVTVPKRKSPLPPPLYLKDDENQTNPKDDNDVSALQKTSTQTANLSQTPNFSPSGLLPGSEPPPDAPPKCPELNHEGDENGPEPPSHQPNPSHPPHDPHKRLLSLPPEGSAGSPRRDSGPHRMMNGFQSVSRGGGFPPTRSNNVHRFETESNYNDTPRFQQNPHMEHQHQPRYPPHDVEERWNDHSELPGPPSRSNNTVPDYEYLPHSRRSHSGHISGDMRNEMTPPPGTIPGDGPEQMYHPRMQHQQHHQRHMHYHDGPDDGEHEHYGGRNKSLHSADMEYGRAVNDNNNASHMQFSNRPRDRFYSLTSMNSRDEYDDESYYPPPPPPPYSSKLSQQHRNLDDERNLQPPVKRHQRRLSSNSLSNQSTGPPSQHRYYPQQHESYSPRSVGSAQSRRAPLPTRGPMRSSTRPSAPPIGRTASQDYYLSPGSSGILPHNLHHRGGESHTPRQHHMSGHGSKTQLQQRDHMPPTQTMGSGIKRQFETPITPGTGGKALDVGTPSSSSVIIGGESSMNLGRSASHHGMSSGGMSSSSLTGGGGPPSYEDYRHSPYPSYSGNGFHANSPPLTPGGGHLTSAIKKTILRRKCAWKNYPELEAFLIANREEYLRHSAMNYTVQQKQYNNRLTERLLEVAAKHNYVFDENDFNFVAVRDRIRCYYKSYVQSSKKRGIIVGYSAQQQQGQQQVPKKRKLSTGNAEGKSSNDDCKQDVDSEEKERACIKLPTVDKSTSDDNQKGKDNNPKEPAEENQTSTTPSTKSQNVDMPPAVSKSGSDLGSTATTIPPTKTIAV